MVNYNLGVTYDIDKKKFKEKAAPLMAQNSGGTYNSDEQSIVIEYLGDKYKVTHPEGEVTFLERDGEVDLKVKVLLLHYLYAASGVPLMNRKISFKEVPGGDIYIDPFNRRTVIPFVNMFGEKAEDFKKVAEMMNGTPDTMGDVSYSIPVFPKVPVTYVLWEGDDEFPASGTVLFDASATSYLPTEDFAVIAQFAVFKMKALLAKL